MGFNNIEYENAHKPWHPRGVVSLGILIHSQCVATLIKINHSFLQSWFHELIFFRLEVCMYVNVRLQSVCIPRFSFYYRRRLYPGSPGRHPCFIAGSALQLQKSTRVGRNEVLKRDSTGGLSSYYRCENLTTNYLTPLLSVCNVMHAIGSSYPTKVTCLFVWAAKAGGGCPIGAFFNLTFLVRLVVAPRLVLMRCTTRSEVVLFLTGLSTSGVSMSFRSVS